MDAAAPAAPDATPAPEAPDPAPAAAPAPEPPAPTAPAADPAPAALAVPAPAVSADAAPEAAAAPEGAAAPEPPAEVPAVPAVPAPEAAAAPEVAAAPESPADVSVPAAAPEPEVRTTRKRGRGASDALDPGRATQSARTGGLLTTASSRQAQKALEDEAVFRRERIFDVYHAVESLCFYTAKEIAAQMQVVDGALTVRVPHGPTVMRIVVADLLAVLPTHILALRSLSKAQTDAWFPADDTHWGLDRADQLPDHRRRGVDVARDDVRGGGERTAPATVQSNHRGRGEQRARPRDALRARARE